MHDVRIDLGEFQVQEQAVKPCGVVVRQVEPVAPVLEEVLVEVQRVGERGEFLRLRGRHHFLDSLLRVGLGVVVFGDGIGVLFLEDVREGREPECSVCNGDAACRVEPCHEAEHDEQA